MIASHTRTGHVRSRHGHRRFALASGVGLAALLVSVLTTTTPAFAVGQASSTTAASTTASSSDPTGNVFVPLSQPVRICDTRPTSESTVSDACTGHTLSAGGSITVDMPSAFVPPTATAAVLGVAVTNTAGQGFITVWPSNESMPTVSNLDYTKGQTISNTVTVGLGTAGAVSLYNGPPTGTGGSADVIVDLEGYYGPSITTTNAGEFTALSPARIADTRCGRSPNGPGSDCSAEAIPSANDSLSLLSPGNSINVAVAGLGGVPAASDVSGVVLNVTTTNASGPGYISAYPTGSANPATAPTPFSNQQFTFDSTISTKVVVGLGTNGDVSIYDGPARGGSYVDVVVDVDGYFSSPNGPAGSLFTPTTPVRLLDNRVTGTPLAPGSSEQLPIAGANGVPAGSAGAVLNVTDVATKGNFLTVYPDDGSLPTTSDVNYSTFDPYDVLPNAAYAKLGADGGIKIYNGPADTKNNAASAFVVVDLFGYFTPPTTAVNTVTISPSSPKLSANGSTQVFTITVDNPSGNPVGGDSLTYTLAPPTGGTSAACGSLNPNRGTTGTSGATDGVATTTYTSSTTAGFCNLTVVESSTGGTATDQIDQTAATLANTPYAVTISPTTASVLANGTATTSLTVTVKDSTGAAVSGDDVTFDVTGNPTAACGSISPLTNPTNSAGVDTVTYTASSTGGTCTVTALEEADGQQSAVPAVITQSVGNVVVVSASPQSVHANGTDTSNVTATVTSLTGPVNGDTVTFATSASPLGACGTLSSPTATTGTNGTTTPAITYTASGTVGTCTITATENATKATGQTIIDQQSVTPPTNTPYKISITGTPTSLLANGSATSTLTVTVLGANSAAIPGDPVDLLLSGSPGGACGTTTPANPNPTLVGGTATFTYTASRTAGTCTINALELVDGQTTTVPVVITQTALDTIAVSAAPSSLPANGTSKSTITATVTNSGGGVNGDTVDFTLSGSACGTLSSTSGTTSGTGGSAGEATVTYTASSSAGPCTVTATETATASSAQTTVDQTTVTTTPYVVTVTATPSSVSANGKATSTIGVTVKDQTGAAVANDEVAVTGVPATGSPSTACGTLSPSEMSTNGLGVATFTYTAGTGAGTCNVTATEANDAQSGSTPVAQTGVNSVDVSAGPSSLPADGKSTSAITVTVTSPSGSAVTGDAVTFGLSGTACGSIVQTPPFNTNGTGQVTVTYQAGTSAGTCTITATEASTGSSGQAAITQILVVPESVTVTADPSSIPANTSDTSAVTATVTGTDGELIADDPVVLSVVSSAPGVCSLSQLNPQSGSTNASGVFTTTYTASTTPGTCTITATELTGHSGAATITQSTANTITLSPSKVDIAATTSATQVFTATVKNVEGSPVGDDTVDFATIAAYPAGACGTLSSPTGSGPTNSSGQTTVTYTASNTSGFCGLAAEELAFGNSAAASIDQTTSPVPSDAPYTVTVTPSPSTLPADGVATSTVTIGVKATNGSSVSSDPLLLTVSGSGCGTLSSSTATTGSGGTATVTYTAGSIFPATCTITADEANTAQSGSGQISQVQPINKITLSANPPSVFVNLLTPDSTITATVTNAAGQPVANDPVTFTVTGNCVLDLLNLVSCGSTFPMTVDTNSAGVAQTAYTGDIDAIGTATITGTEAQTNQSASTEVSQIISVL